MSSSSSSFCLPFFPLSFSLVFSFIFLSCFFLSFYLYFLFLLFLFLVLPLSFSVLFYDASSFDVLSSPCVHMGDWCFQLIKSVQRPPGHLVYFSNKKITANDKNFASFYVVMSLLFVGANFFYFFRLFLFLLYCWKFLLLLLWVWLPKLNSLRWVFPPFLHSTQQSIVFTTFWA